MDYQLDLTAYTCPLPLLITKRAIQQLSKGERLLLKVSPYTIFSDFELLCQQQGDLSIVQLELHKWILYKA
ncbi:sulfurtransferase TusA family protein [Ursidibacter sp. B-7004-1]